MDSKILSIDIPYKSKLATMVLTYGTTLYDLDSWRSEGFIKKDNKYLLDLELPIGQTKINYKYNDNDYTIIIELEEEKKTIGTYFSAERFMNVYIKIEYTDDKEFKKELLFDFIESARKYHNRKNENEILCKILRNGHWSILNRLPKRKLETVYLPKKEKDLIFNDIKSFMDSKTEYNSLGIPWKRNYLLEGPPGTGKTSLIFSLASEFNLEIFIINLGPKVDDSVFMSAVSNLPNNAILLLEDVDALFVDRKANDSNKSLVSFSGILNVLDGMARKEGLITFLTTNYKNRLDRALIRPGRVDFCMQFDKATNEQIEMMYLKFLPDQTDKLSEFLGKISNYKITMSCLQQFLLECRFGKKSPLKFKRLRQIMEQIESKDETPIGLYN